MLDADNLFFDLDGTLCDTQADVLADMGGTLAALGLDEARFFETFRIGPPLHQALREIYPEIQPATSERFIQEFRDRYDASDYPQTVPYPGIVSLLQRAKADEKRLFIATNKRYRPTVRIMEKFGLTGLFADIFAVDKIPGSVMSKVEMLRTPGVEPNRSVMIGDSASDILAGQEAGFSTVAVTWGYESAEKLQAAGPDFLAANAEELALYLGVG